MDRFSRIQPFGSYPGIMAGSHDARNTNRPFYGFGIRSYLAQSEGNSPPAKISSAERLTPVAIIDGHPHNPSKLPVLAFTPIWFGVAFVPEGRLMLARSFNFWCE
jgi:hypothetical protein